MGIETTTATVPAATTGCFRLIYRSHSLMSAGAAGQSELADILKGARVKNAGLGITGALMLHDDWFAQILEGPQAAVEDLFTRIKADPRHNSVRLSEAGPTAKHLFDKWAMAIVAEHHELDMPMVATSGGLAQGAPWRVSVEQEAVLTGLRDMTRGYGRGS